jgi:hypothetical protein
MLEIARRLPFSLAWERIEGHQDEQQKWHQLTWMETLSIRTDCHATTGLSSNTNTSHHASMIPSSKTGLRVAGTNITSHHATPPQSCHPTAMLARCLKRCGWTMEEMFVTKFVHQSLAMGPVQHKINPSQPITCSSSKQWPESEIHLCQCSTCQVAMEDVFFDVTLCNFRPQRTTHLSGSVGSIVLQHQ